MGWEDIYQSLISDTEDYQAWKLLERKVHAWARATFWKYGHDAIDDVVAETCAAVALSLTGARGADSFRGFVYGHFLNARRRILKMVVPSGYPLGGMDVPAPLDHDDRVDAEMLARLRQALSRLPQRERTAILMRYFLNRNSAEIALKLGVTSGNARRIIFTGMSRLRATLCASAADWRPSPDSAAIAGSHRAARQFARR
jgi:RNA polymerase sigma factor (sigma-70 family)